MGTPREALMNRASGALVGIGSLLVVVTIGWWWITYGEVVGYGYLSWPEAGRCLIQNSDICSLAKALCLGSHPRALFPYWTSAFWLAAAVFSASLLTLRQTKRLP